MIGLMQFLPSVLLALPAGHLADQYNRKTLIVVGQVVECIAVVGLITLTVDVLALYPSAIRVSSAILHCESSGRASQYFVITCAVTA